MTTRSGRRRLGPDGYRLVLPDGWTQLDVRREIDRTVSEALAQIPFTGIPRDERSRRRAAVEGRLRLAIANAKKIDAYAMYLSLTGMHGMAVPASFVVAEATDFSGGGPPEEVLAQLLTAPGASAVQVDGSDGVRTETTTTGLDERSGQQIPARQVVYTVAVPDSLQWLIVVYDVVSDAGMDENATAFVNALIMLFDAVMTTFRWQFDDD